MKNICKGLVILCILAGVFIFVPGNAQAAKLTMKNTDSKITLKYDDRYTFKKGMMNHAFHKSVITPVLQFRLSQIMYKQAKKIVKCLNLQKAATIK